MWWIYTAFSAWLFLVGAIFGSFLNVVMYRSLAAQPKRQGEKWHKGRSRCDSCHKIIAWYDNLPLFSFLILGGRCRHCQIPIGLNHPVIELLAGCLFVWWYWAGVFVFRLSSGPFSIIQPLFWLVVGVLLLYIFLTDLVYYIIPNMALVVLMIVTLGYRLALVTTGFMRWEDFGLAILSMVGSVVFLGSLWLITKGRGLGFGDVKFMIPLGLLLGWPGTLVMLFLAFAIGSVVGVGLLLSKRCTFGQAVPFGPFLVIGTCLSLVWGPELFGWYLRLIGL